MSYRQSTVERPAGYYGPMRRDLRIHYPDRPKARPLAGVNLTRVPILAFDPGGTTGWSLLVLPRQIRGRDVFSYDPATILRNAVIWEHGEMVTTGDEDAASFQLFKMCQAWPGAAIVVEDFILRVERKEKSRELLSPVRITAKLEAYLWRNTDRCMFKQDPSQAKRVTDDRLKALGAIAEDGLPDHARDADRHAVMFMRRCIGPQGVGLKRVAWPELYGVIGGEPVDEEELEDASA
ncbi:hypothetical protein SEA_ZENON_85 [Mycobacterium phage Zenon]|uniref:RuvC-like resolvase n=1 Tax=Mycobacterium phage Zenon TaxID=1983573 RepID=A0A1Z1LWX9_9CAUD|nr:hypothetical protein SEA_ZENON_85 [Mycobacterium phage Zenon]